MLGLCFVPLYFVSFLVLQLSEKRELGCFNVVVF